jgi:hypothetical protein
LYHPTGKWLSLAAGIVVLAILMTSGCQTSSVQGTTEASPTNTGPSTPPISLGPPGQPGCRPPSPIGNDLEVQGTAQGGELWALLMPVGDPPLRSGVEIKIVWRMTGSGDLNLTANGATGGIVRPTWGPDKHSGSTWNRPGAEWGAGFVFPAAGCWDIRAARSDLTGHVWLIVAK